MENLIKEEMETFAAYDRELIRLYELEKRFNNRIFKAIITVKG